MMEKTPRATGTPAAPSPIDRSKNQATDQSAGEPSRAKARGSGKIFENLPGTEEGRAALIEFEMAEMDFVEEQQAFDFGAEFKEAPPTAAMLDTAAFVPAGMSVTDEEDESSFAGDADAQMDFEEAARRIAAEDAAAEAKATSEPEELELGLGREAAMMLDEIALPRLKVSADEELMRAINAIPQKMAFKIGEVGEMIGVKQYVLRYWETEFDALRPRKSKNGQRVYTRREVETALMIKKLLYTDRFSIEGARGALKQLKSRVREEKGWGQLLVSHDHVRDGLKSLLTEIRRLRDVLV